MLFHEFALTVCAVVLLPRACRAEGDSVVPPPVDEGNFLIESVEFLSETVYPSFEEVEGGLIGGISGITFDSNREVYYMVCFTFWVVSSENRFHPAFLTSIP